MGDLRTDKKRVLKAEIARLHRIIKVAAKRATALHAVIDKLTAAQLHIERLMKMLRVKR